MKIIVLEDTGAFVKGPADVSPEIAARMYKAGQCEFAVIAEDKKEPEVSPVLTSENTVADKPVADEVKASEEIKPVADEVKASEAEPANQENV